MPTLLALQDCDILLKSKVEGARGQPPISPTKWDVVLLSVRIFTTMVALYHCILQPDAFQGFPQIKAY